MGEVIHRVDKFKQKAENQGTSRWISQGFAPQSILVSVEVPQPLSIPVHHSPNRLHQLPVVSEDRKLIQIDNHRRTSSFPNPAS